MLLGCVAVVAQWPIVVKLSRGQSVGLSIRTYMHQSICRSVRLSSALWQNGGSDLDAVWHHRSDGSGDEAGSGVWGSVHGKGVLLGPNVGHAIVTNGNFMAYGVTVPRHGPLPKLLWAYLLTLF